jgi:hypothetical protein
MRLKIDLAASVAKDKSHPELNEDAWATDAEFTCFALCDGATVSYDSQRWARLLASRYALNPNFMPAWVHAAVAEYGEQAERFNLTWSQQGAFDRGSFSTLLGLQLANNQREVEVLAVGDSLACHIRAGALLTSFPYTTFEQFDQRPTLLSTIGAQNAFVSEPNFFTCNTSRTWSIEPGDTILMLTDAVGEWMLREIEQSPSSLQSLAMVTSLDELAELTQRMRTDGRMRCDDTTLLRLAVLED